MKVVGILALHTGRFSSPRIYALYSFLLGAESTSGHSAAGGIMSMKNSNDTIANRTRASLLLGQCLNQLRHRMSQCQSMLKFNILIAVTHVRSNIFVEEKSSA